MCLIIHIKFPVKDLKLLLIFLFKIFLLKIGQCSNLIFCKKEYKTFDILRFFFFGFFFIRHDIKIDKNTFKYEEEKKKHFSLEDKLT